MMKGALVAMASVVAFAGCQSIRVSGVIKDEVTGAPIWPCAVTIGPRSAAADVLGRYSIQAKKQARGQFSVFSGKDSREMEVYCKGYARKTVEVSWDETRYPKVNVLMQPAP